MQIGSLQVAAKPLQMAQPLAYKVLSAVQVACRNHGSCGWSGDYGDFLHHITSHADDGPQEETERQPASAPVDVRKPSEVSLVKKKISEAAVPEESSCAEESPVKEETQKEDAAVVFPTAAVTSTTASPRKNESIASNPVPEKPSSPIQSEKSTEEKAHEAPINTVEEKKSDPLAKTDHSNTLQEIDASPRKVRRGSVASTISSTNDDSQTRNNDYHQSIDSTAAAWSTTPSDYLNPASPSSPSSDDGSATSFADDAENGVSGKEPRRQKSTQSLQQRDVNDSDRLPDDDDEQQSREIFEAAEKLKKQANAKFNKGDFEAARELYTEGIEMMKEIDPTTDEEFMLLSNMHSNRSVTFFREKLFDLCIQDCDRAIDYDPQHDKSWIRKWRGLMAKGEFEEAHACIKEATVENPSSKKIKAELRKTEEEMDILNEAKRLMQKSEFTQTQEFLKGVCESCDNIALLCFAARADIALGETDAALDKVDRSLRINPGYGEALELRGVSHFLAGDTEEGARILYEAYNDNKSLSNVKIALGRIQKAHAEFSSARSEVKKGLYKSAIEHFTAAIKESEPLPPKAPLFAKLRTERAEAYLLSMQFLFALKDCQEVVSVRKEHAAAWVVRSEVLIALGKAEDAKKELAKIRRTWGSDNPTIEEGYHRVDFELRVVKANEDLVRFVSELDSGTSERLPAPEAKQRTRRSSMGGRSVSSTRGLGSSSQHGTATRGKRADTRYSISHVGSASSMDSLVQRSRESFSKSRSSSAALRNKKHSSSGDDESEQSSRKSSRRKKSDDESLSSEENRRRKQGERRSSRNLGRLDLESVGKDRRRRSRTDEMSVKSEFVGKSSGTRSSRDDRRSSSRARSGRDDSNMGPRRMSMRAGSGPDREERRASSRPPSRRRPSMGMSRQRSSRNF
jgi:tetratricopeptide (TPR) repeat protein